jgi:hypothetical protein
MRLFPLYSIVILAITAWTASHEIPDTKPCEKNIFMDGGTQITYLPYQENCLLGTLFIDSNTHRDYRYSMSNTGLFYVWDLPESGYFVGERTDYKHVVAFLPPKSAPFPHPLPNEIPSADFYLHLANGENVILNTMTGKIDWKRSFEEGLTSINIEESLPGANGKMIKIRGYKEDGLLVDFGSSNTTDPFLVRGGKATIYKYVRGQKSPRVCTVPNNSFWSAKGYEPDFSQARIDAALKACEAQRSWTK